MIRRWSHGHTFATGCAFILLLGHPLLVTLLATLMIFAGGFLAGWFSRRLRDGARTVAHRADELHRAKLADLRASRRLKLSKAWESRKALLKAYWDGARDGAIR